MTWQVINGNNIDILKKYDDDTFDSIVTDPPYGIAFLGKDWDNNTGALETWQECFRVLKPGGHLLAFSAARTYHHLATNIEMAGFEIRDQLMWLYGQGMPKTRQLLKPAHEPIVMARKSMTKKYNDLNIDASRVKQGRYPANVIMDAEAGAILDKQAPKTGNASSSKRTKTSMTGTGASLQWHKKAGESNGISDGLSGASKFFYCPKVSKSERMTFNNHPTVKPVELMKYLVRLVTPKNGKVLDPFNGSGSTGMACEELDYDYTGIELDPEYVEISKKRISVWQEKYNTHLFEYKGEKL